MTTTMPSRAAIERAEPLDFDTTRSEKQANISLTAGPNGLIVTIEWTGPVSGIPAAIERLRASGVLDLVTTSKPATHTAPLGGNTPARKGVAMITTPQYLDNGAAVCPVHGKELQAGRYGPYCPSRAEGEHANAKGYCNIRFSE